MKIHDFSGKPTEEPKNEDTEHFPRILGYDNTCSFRLVQTNADTIVLERMSTDAMGVPLWIQKDSVSQSRSFLISWLMRLTVKGAQG